MGMLRNLLIAALLCSMAHTSRAQMLRGNSLVLYPKSSLFDTLLIKAPTLSAPWTLTLPTTAGTSNYFLQTDGMGVTTWAAVTSGIDSGNYILNLPYHFTKIQTANFNILGVGAITSPADTDIALTLTSHGSGTGTIQSWKNPGGQVARVAYDGAISSNSDIIATGNLSAESGTVLLGTGSFATGIVEFLESGSSHNGQLTAALLTANRTWTLPDATGTIALIPSGGADSGSYIVNQNAALQTANFSISGSGNMNELSIFDNSGSGNSATIEMSSATPHGAYLVTIPPVGGTLPLTGANGGLLTAGTGITITNSGNATTIASAGLTNPMTTAGDIIYGGTSGTPTRRAIGSPYYPLVVDHVTDLPSWEQLDLTQGVQNQLPLANGGTGLNAVPTDGQLLIGQTSDNSLGLATITAGANVTVTNAGHSITIAATSSGTVTSFSSGNLSPLFTTSVATATTTPALSFSLNTQSPNLVFAGPTSGLAAAPTFRALVAGDLPAISFADSSRASHIADTAKKAHYADTSKVTHFADTSRVSHFADSSRTSAPLFTVPQTIEIDGIGTAIDSGITLKNMTNSGTQYSPAYFMQAIRQNGVQHDTMQAAIYYIPGGGISFNQALLATYSNPLLQTMLLSQPQFNGGGYCTFPASNTSYWLSGIQGPSGTSSVGTPWVFRAGTGIGGNNAGVSVELIGGIATGNSKSGPVLLQSAKAIASGTTLQSPYTIHTFDTAGEILSSETAVVAANATTLSGHSEFYIIPANGGVSVAVTAPAGTKGRKIILENLDATASTTGLIVTALKLQAFLYDGTAWLTY